MWKKTAIAIAEVIADGINQKGWSTQSVAAMLNVKVSTVEAWKAGNVNLDLRTIVRIELLLDIKLISRPDALRR
jgi:ribosome-binding protein aMBF1 (putative translation factor)